MRPLVSVVIPSFNAAQFIIRCLDSVFRQSVDSLEVIVVDDASTDDTAHVVSQYGAPNLTLIRQPQNQGVCAARNRGVEFASGEWIAVMDADDWMSPHRLEYLVRDARRLQADIVVDDVYLVPEANVEALFNHTVLERQDRSSPPLPHRRLFSSSLRSQLPRAIDASFFIRHNMPGPRNPRLGLTKPLIRTDWLRQHGVQFDPDVGVSNDFKFCVDCFRHNPVFYILDHTTYYYVLQESGITKTSDPLRADSHRLEVTLQLMQSPDFADPDLQKAFSERVRALERQIRFHRFRQSIESKSGAGVARQALRTPTDAFSYVRQRSISQFDRQANRCRRGFKRLFF
jgi:succinoglycan biosynthesis protein ExoO